MIVVSHLFRHGAAWGFCLDSPERAGQLGEWPKTPSARSPFHSSEGRGGQQL